MFDNIRSAYFIGIKGVGMTALAQVLKEKYHIKVTGSDTEDKFFTDDVLKKHKIKFYNGFKEKNLPKQVDLVVVSSAYNNQCSEVKEAEKRGFKIIRYSDGLAMLFEDSFGVAVCGSHGKTTTTAMLGYVFKKAGLKPTVIVGSNVPQFKGNALVGNSKYLIVEADEYQAKILQYKPKAIILTNIDYDHPDFFKTRKEYKKVFWDFIKKLPQDGILVANSDDKDVSDLVKKAKQQKLKIKILEYGHNIASPTLELNLKIPGIHNISNASAVFTFAKYLSVSEKKIIKYLNEFRGTTRRFEYKGKYRGALVIDDYAHHPTEIAATLKAAREKYPNKNIWCVFHPHTFSRTQALFKEFSKSFYSADNVIILDIYNSAREKSGKIHSSDLVRAIKKTNKGVVLHIPTKEKTVEYLKQNAKKNDIIITMGAGDVWLVGERLLRKK